MFVTAIEQASKFTRPIHIILRYHGSTEVQPYAASLFFVNAQGWALTCRHVADHLTVSDVIVQKRRALRADLAAAPATANLKKLRQRLEQKHDVGPGKIVDVRNNFMDCIEGPLDVAIIRHPDSGIDAALLHFRNYTKLLCTEFPTFAATGSDAKQGKYLCRLGFPFPEFSNYRYDASTDELEWLSSGQIGTPSFPIEGMLTRRVLDATGQVCAFEMSTPGLKGQSGGPAFDVEGRVWGMQFGTVHLDLDFDIKQEVTRDGKRKRVDESAFLHVGRCVHVDILKQFMASNAVQFSEG